jgi:hypothetical protein
MQKEFTSRSRRPVSDADRAGDESEPCDRLTLGGRGGIEVTAIFRKLLELHRKLSFRCFALQRLVTPATFRSGYNDLLYSRFCRRERHKFRLLFTFLL